MTAIEFLPDLVLAQFSGCRFYCFVTYDFWFGIMGSLLVSVYLACCGHASRAACVVPPSVRPSCKAIGLLAYE